MAIRVLLLDPAFHVFDDEFFLVSTCNITGDINRIHLFLGDGCCSLCACKFDDPFIVVFPMRNEALRNHDSRGRPTQNFSLSPLRKTENDSQCYKKCMKNGHDETANPSETGVAPLGHPKATLCTR